jgi:hypothetical protein
MVIVGRHHESQPVLASKIRDKSTFGLFLQALEYCTLFPLLPADMSETRRWANSLPLNRQRQYIARPSGHRRGRREKPVLHPTRVCGLYTPCYRP